MVGSLDLGGIFLKTLEHCNKLFFKIGVVRNREEEVGIMILEKETK